MTGILSCNYCHRSTRLTEAGARFTGWRIFRGESLTGVTLDDVICPVCSGRGKEEPEVPSWDIRCTLCNWRYLEDLMYSDIPLISAKEAATVAKRHECEPVFEFMDPGNGTIYLEHDPEFLKLVRGNVTQAGEDQLLLPIEEPSL